MGEFCLPLAPKYIGPNSQGRLTLNDALFVDPSNTLTRRSVGADNFQKEHTSNRAGNRPVTHNSQLESNTRERARYLCLSIYSQFNLSILSMQTGRSRGLYRRPDEDLTAPHCFVAAMVRHRRLSCLPSCACLSLYCQFECPSLSCTNFAGRHQLLTSQLKPKPACQ